MLKCRWIFSRPNFSPAAFAVRRYAVARIERSEIRVRPVGWAERSDTHHLFFKAHGGFRFALPTLRKIKRKEVDRRQTHCGQIGPQREPVRKRRTGRAADKAACAALPLRARSPAGVPPRFCPRGVWSLGAIRARLRGCFATAADMTAGSAPTSSGAPRTPVIVPAGMMPGPPGSRLMRPARGLRTRPLPPGITRTASFMGRVSPYVSMNRTDVNGGVTKKFARVPGAARVRCRPGIVKSATPAKVPDQRCTTTARRRRA